MRQFAESGPDDLHFRLDHVAGEVQFGPAVRLADGSLRHYGAVPPRGATLLLTSYRSGGGRRGNVTAGQVRVLKTSVPYVARVENRAAAVGGSDAETLEDAKVRGPMLLRARGRAVTAEDFVQLARDVAPEAARVHCAASREGDEGEGVLVLVVPTSPVTTSAGSAATTWSRRRACSSGSRGARRAAGWSAPGCWSLLRTTPGLTVVADVHARERYDADVVHDDVLRALYGFLDPLTGGPGRHGLAVRTLGPVARGARGAGPDPRRRHGAGGVGDALPGRPRDGTTGEPGAAAGPARRRVSSSPTSTRSGCSDAS